MVYDIDNLCYAIVPVWYRHTGQPRIQDIPYDCTFKEIEDESEIIRDIGNHSITHMYIMDGVIPSLKVVGPRLTHLKVGSFYCLSQLQRYVYFIY